MNDENGAKPGGTCSPFFILPVISLRHSSAEARIASLSLPSGGLWTGGKLPGIFTANAASSVRPFFSFRIWLSWCSAETRSLPG